jgi:hypothetical protein
MKPWLGLVVFVGMSVCMLASRPARSEDAASNAAADERLQEVKELIEQSVEWYEVLPEAEAKATLRPQVVLRWRNAERTNTGAAVLAIWTDHGRPEVMATIFQNENGICHEFGSLSRSKKIVIRDKTRVVWSPEKAGVEFRDLPDAPAPAGDRAARLRQMKSLAERFTARLPKPTVGDGSPEVLRLLPRPLYRYDVKDVKDSSQPLRDGGMFAFVMGTDPEVVLLLEAVEREGKAVWQYACARATTYAVEASLGDQVVWSVESAWGPNRTNSLMQITRPIPR